MEKYKNISFLLKKKTTKKNKKKTSTLYQELCKGFPIPILMKKFIPERKPLCDSTSVRTCISLLVPCLFCVWDSSGILAAAPPLSYCVGALSQVSLSLHWNCLIIDLYHYLGKFSKHSCKIFTRQHIDDIFLIFPRKQILTFQANCLQQRGFACNVKICFPGKIRKIFQYVVCKKFYPAC